MLQPRFCAGAATFMPQPRFCAGAATFMLQPPSCCSHVHATAIMCRPPTFLPQPVLTCSWCQHVCACPPGTRLPTCADPLVAPTWVCVPAWHAATHLCLPAHGANMCARAHLAHGYPPVLIRSRRQHGCVSQPGTRLPTCDARLAV